MNPHKIHTIPTRNRGFSMFFPTRKRCFRWIPDPSARPGTLPAELCGPGPGGGDAESFGWDFSWISKGFLRDSKGFLWIYKGFLGDL